MKLSKKNSPTISEPNTIFCSFGLEWFVLRFFLLYWFGFDHPSDGANLCGKMESCVINCLSQM